MMAALPTTNFDAMREFYADTIGLRKQSPETRDSVWFRDFGGSVELQIERVGPGEERPAAQFMCIRTEHAARYAERFEARGLPCSVRRRESAVDVTIKDPDGNELLITTEKKA